MKTNTNIKTNIKNRDILHTMNGLSYNYQPEFLLDESWAIEHGHDFQVITLDNLHESTLDLVEYFRHLSDHLQFNDTLYFLLGDDFAY